MRLDDAEFVGYQKTHRKSPSSLQGGRITPLSIYLFEQDSIRDAPDQVNFRMTDREYRQTYVVPKKTSPRTV